MILFVDDENSYVDSYVQDLRLEGYRVEFQDCHYGPDAALEFLERNADQIDLLILDIIMPPGTVFENINTELSLRTGIAFFERARDIRSELDIIILTNVSDENVIKRFESEKKCLCLQKENYYPFELSTIVGNLLTNRLPLTITKE